MEELVKELLKKHDKDRDLTDPKVQQEVKTLRKKYNRIDKDLGDDGQLVGLDWSEANLRGFVLRNLLLSSIQRPANFNKADLYEAHLEEACLMGAYLEEAYLVHASLEKASLYHAQLERGKMESANLKYADLSYANLVGAKLNIAKLKGANLEHANLEGVDLTIGIFGNTYFQETNLKGAKLVYAMLRGEYLSHVNLEGANLHHAFLQGAILEEVNLKDTNLIEANFLYADLYLCKFDGSNIEYAVLSDKDIHEIEKKELVNVVDKLKQENIIKDISKKELPDLIEYIDKKTINGIKKHIESIFSDRNRYRKAEDTYRNIKNTLHQNGAYDKESEYHYKERRARTKHLKKTGKYGKWFLHTLFRLLCGYGEKPLRVIACFVGLISFFSFFFGVTGGIMPIPEAVVLRPLDYIYFSLITATTLSFGDIVPNPAVGLMDISWFRIAAMIEAFLGTFLLALFVVVAAKRIMR